MHNKKTTQNYYRKFYIYLSSKFHLNVDLELVRCVVYPYCSESFFFLTDLLSVSYPRQIESLSLELDNLVLGIFFLTTFQNRKVL